MAAGGLSVPVKAIAAAEWIGYLSAPARSSVPKTLTSIGMAATSKRGRVSSGRKSVIAPSPAIASSGTIPVLIPQE